MGQTNSRQVEQAIAAAPLAPSRVAGTAAVCGMPAADQRADGQHRTVTVGRDCVRIDRRLAGIAMRVAVPLRSYRGVALSLQAGTDGALHYQISLVHRDADLSVALEGAGDDVEILADWRAWSRFLRLPALVERRPGLIEEADPMLGGVLLGKAGLRRRPRRSRSKRRPMFLTRRKIGIPALAALSHVGEREIIARH